jgi:transcriptional regulatory protein GAL4
LDELDTNLPVASSADILKYMNDYFTIYHTAYPILHEGTFRARVSGMHKIYIPVSTIC